MAKRLRDGSILLEDGRIIYANTVVLAQDIPEILALLSPPPAWPFISGGGGSPGPQGLPGPQGPPGPAGSLEGPVVGGSGTFYTSIALGITGEVASPGQYDRITGLVPQAGTGPGVLVGPGSLSAVDDFYKDYFVVNTDTTPSNGLVSQWARVASYAGATRTMTLDKPWDFSSESDFVLLKPIRLALLEDLTEDVDLTVSTELDFSGHRIRGTFNITGDEYHKLEGGSGYVTDGIQKSNFGVLIAEDLTVSRRGTSLYALLMTEGSNLGRCEVFNCRFAGSVAGRRGFSGWEIKNCFNYGVVTPDGLFNAGFRLVESIAGVAIVFSAIDLQINSDFNGSVFYSENSLTSIGAAYMSMNGTMAVQGEKLIVTDVAIANSSSFAVAVGSATLSLNMGSSSGGRVRVFVTAFAFPNITPQSTPGFSILTARNFSGSATFTINQAFTVSGDGLASIRGINVEGTSVPMSGSVTIDGGVVRNIIGAGTPGLALIYLNASVTGSVTVSGAGWALRQMAGVIVQNIVAQTAGAPVITVSADLLMDDFLINPIGATATWYNSLNASITVGTWTISGRIIAPQILGQTFVNHGSGITGGSWILSGELQLFYEPSTHAAGVNLILFFHAGSTSTVTISGTIFLSIGKYNGTFEFARSSGPSSNINVTSASVVIANGVIATGGSVFRAITGAAPVLTVSGSYTFLNMRFQGATILVDAAAVGGTLTAPSSVIFDKTDFLSTLVFQSGAGTIIWAGASCRMDYTRFDGLLTIVGTSFSSIEAYFTTFNGNSGNNSISFSGTRPTTYRLWKCNFNGRPDAAGLPEIIDDYVVRPASGALAKGNLVTINASGQAVAPGAASVVEGILLAATAVLGDAAVLVRRGQVFVDSDATVVAGDNCNLDSAGTTTQQIAGAPVLSQRTGRALEATGTTIAGEAYTVVNLM